jgi:hypothetical protein
VQLAQYAPARPFLPPLPAPFSPGTPANKEWADGFIGSNIHAGRVIGDWIRGIFHNDEDESQTPPITPRPDLPPLAGGRGGRDVPNLTGPPNSAIPAAPGRIYVTDGQGNVILDVTRERTKNIRQGRRSKKVRPPTAEELDLLDKMGR